MNRKIKTTLSKKKIGLDLLSILSFLIPFTVYLYTSPRTITGYADSAGLITLATNFQSAHPPGYPLFIILGHLFSLLPVGTIPFRFSLMTSFFGALSVFFIYKILNILFQSSGAMEQLPNNRSKSPLPFYIMYSKYLIIQYSYFILPFLGSQFIAFFYSFWLYSITPEVFALNNLMAVTIIYITLYIVQNKDTCPVRCQKLSNGVFLLFGLGLSNHMTVVLLLFPVIYYLFINRILRAQIIIIRCIISLIIGITPYVLILILSYRSHYPMYGNVPGITRFVEYITRSDYGGLLSGGVKESLKGEEGPIGMFLLYIWTLIKGYTFVPVVGYGYFVYKHFLKYKTKEAFIVYLSIITGVVFPLFSLFGLSTSDLHSVGVAERFSLLGYIFIGIVSVLGISEIIGYLSPKIHLNRTPHFIGSCLLLTFTTLFIAVNFPRVNKRDYRLAYNYGMNILGQVDNGSVVFATDDLTNFVLIYLTQTEKVKSDTKIIGFGFLDNINYQKELKGYWPDLYETDSIYSYDIARDIIRSNSEKQGVYFASFDDPYPLGFLGNPYFLKPEGLLLKADQNLTKEQIIESSKTDNWGNYNFDAVNEKYEDAFARLNVYNYFFKTKINVQVYQYLDCPDCAKRELDNASLHLISYKEEFNKSHKELKGLKYDNPRSSSELLALAKNRFASASAPTFADMNRSLYDLQRAEKLDPDNEEVLGGLGEAYEMIGLYDYALDRYRKASKINPYGGWQESINRVTKTKNKINFWKYF